MLIKSELGIFFTAYLYMLTGRRVFYLAPLNFLNAKVYLKEQIQLKHKIVQIYSIQIDFDLAVAFISIFQNYWPCPCRFLFSSVCHLISSQELMVPISKSLKIVKLKWLMYQQIGLEEQAQELQSAHSVRNERFTPAKQRKGLQQPT